MSWETKPLLLKNGLPIPQQFDPALDKWVEYTNEDIKALRSELALVKAELQAIKGNTQPSSVSNPVNTKDVNSDSTKAELTAVKNELGLVKAELQTIKANQLSGDQKVQLSGTIVGEVTLVNATTATHVSAEYYPIPIDFLRSFSKVEFHIINSFDVALAIGLRIVSGASNVQPSILLEDGEIAPYFPTVGGCVHIVPSGVNNLPLSDLHPETQSGVKSKHPVPFRLFIPTMTTDVRLAVRAYPFGQGSSEGALTIIMKGWS